MADTSRSNFPVLLRRLIFLVLLVVVTGFGLDIYLHPKVYFGNGVATPTASPIEKPTPIESIGMKEGTSSSGSLSTEDVPQIGLNPTPTKEPQQNRSANPSPSTSGGTEAMEPISLGLPESTIEPTRLPEPVPTPVKDYFVDLGRIPPPGSQGASSRLYSIFQYNPGLERVTLTWIDDQNGQRFFSYSKTQKTLYRADHDLGETWRNISLDGILAASEGESLSKGGIYSSEPGDRLLRWFLKGTQGGSLLETPTPASAPMPIKDYFVDLGRIPSPGSKGASSRLYSIFQNNPDLERVTLAWIDDQIGRRFFSYNKTQKTLYRADHDLSETWRNISLDGILAASEGESLSKGGIYSSEPGDRLLRWFLQGAPEKKMVE